jgi:hypothetical protein
MTTTPSVTDIQSYRRLEEVAVEQPPIQQLAAHADIPAFRPRPCSCCSWEALYWIMTPLFLAGVAISARFPETHSQAQTEFEHSWRWVVIAFGLVASVASFVKAAGATSQRQHPYRAAISETLQNHSHQTALAASRRLGLLMLTESESGADDSAERVGNLWPLEEDDESATVTFPPALAPYRRPLLDLLHTQQSPVHVTLRAMQQLMRNPVTHSQWHIRDTQWRLRGPSENRVRLIVSQAGCLVRNGRAITGNYGLKVVTHLTHRQGRFELSRMSLIWTRAGIGGPPIFTVHCTPEHLTSLHHDSETVLNMSLPRTLSHM